ncbi:MAG TPA: MauE/DoxX family redox-associated membrane protein [Micromonosporaceae bacterium]
MDRYSWVAAVQPLPVAALLLWAGAVKLAGRRSAQAAARTALTRLVGTDRVAAAYRGVGAVEVLVGGFLLVTGAGTVAATGAATAATVLSAGFLGYLGWARAVAPDSSCGCLSARRSRITWRAFVRAGLLFVAAAVATTATDGWVPTIAAHPATSVATAVVELALICSFSAELDRYWLLPLRRLRVRLRHPLAGGGFDIPLESSVQQLERSEAFRRVGATLRSAVLDHWDEGEWRLISYAALVEGRRMTAVFAVPRLRYAPDDVRVALVEDAEAGDDQAVPVPA